MDFVLLRETVPPGDAGTHAPGDGQTDHLTVLVDRKAVAAMTTLSERLDAELSFDFRHKRARS